LAGIVSSYLGIAWFVELRWLTKPSRQPESFRVLEAVKERVALRDNKPWASVES